MNIDLIPVGDNPPESLNVIIEVPVGGEPVKYEFDKKSGALFVDRILHTPMRYPANYGFVPHTLSPDVLSNSYFTGSPPTGTSMTTFRLSGGLSPTGIKSMFTG